MYNNAINSCIEDLKSEILSLMPISYDFFMLPLASGLMKGSRLALIETSKIFFNCLQTWEVSPFTPMKRHLLAGYSHAVDQSVITDY